MAVAGLHKGPGLDSYLGNKDRSATRTSFIRKMWRDLENEGRVKENGRLQTSGVIISPESPSASSLEGENETENECKRVRIESTTGLEESTTPTGSQINGVRSSICRIYGRQALIDLLTKFVRERKREVDDLLENKYVSKFAHRHRIQSLLKGRFLRNQRFVEDEKPTSVAASELGFLRQTNAVSDIRKGFLTRLNNSDTISDNEVSNYDHIEQAEEVVQETPHGINETFGTTNLTRHQGSHNPPQSPSSTGEIHDINILQYEETSYQETFGSDFQDLHEEEWYVNENGVDPTESWLGGNNCYWFDDDDDDGSRVVELRELTNRRSVSNLLQSEFGARLDQLMQSYVSRQDQVFESENEWMQDHNQQQRLGENANETDESPQRHRDHDLHGAMDIQFPDSGYHLSTEHELINSLKIDMKTLEQRINEMQKMLETCMDMQLELQRSVHQELYSALNQSSNSKGASEDGFESSPQTENCFLCCDNGFESFPDRSATMLQICSKCARKVNWSELKESVRQP